MVFSPLHEPVIAAKWKSRKNVRKDFKLTRPPDAAALDGVISPGQCDQRVDGEATIRVAGGQGLLEGAMIAFMLRAGSGGENRSVPSP